MTLTELDGLADLASHDTFVPGLPFETLTRLRHEAPVYRHPGGEDTPPWFWLVSRHEDVVRVNRDHETFSSGIKGALLVDRSEEELDMARTMLETDAPDHTRLRKLVNRGFTPRMIRALEGHYRDVTRTIIDRAKEKGTFDFVTEVAAELPLVAIAELLGVPVEDRRKIFDWSNRMVGANDPEYGTSLAEGQTAMMELYAYAHELAEARRSDPRDDIVTTLLSAHDGDQLDDHEFDVFVLLLSVAGNETTRNAISHGLHGLLDHPDEMRRLRDDTGDLLEPMAEEVIRWASPVMQFRRTALHDTEIAGVPIAAGDPVVMNYLSANRDESVFDDPMRLDVGRTPNDHVGFGGGGPHFCLGAHLARIEIRIMFEELLDRTETIEQAGPAERLRSNFINGLKHLPVTVT
jgi:cholest-4-en-3-one 26-monooxygenase